MQVSIFSEWALTQRFDRSENLCQDTLRTKKAERGRSLATSMCVCVCVWKNEQLRDDIIVSDHFQGCICRKEEKELDRTNDMDGLYR